MRRLLLLVPLLLPLLATACAGDQALAADPSRVVSVSTPGRRLIAGSRYDLMRDSGLISQDVQDADRVAAILDRAIHDGLARQGLERLGTAGEPDLWVGWIAAETVDLDRDAIVRRFGLAQGPDDWLDDLPTGTLLVLVMDASTRQLLWRGSIQVAIRRGLDPAARDARLSGHVARLLENLPVVDG